MSDTAFLIETLQRNALLRHYKPEVVFDPFREPLGVVQKFRADARAIDSDPHLSKEGRAAKRDAALQAASERVTQWQAERTSRLDADHSAQRTALTPSVTPSDPRRVDHLLAVLRGLTPQEVAVCYGSASEDERLVMESASALVGRIPTKTREGGVVWTPLLDPEVVAEAVMSRVAASQPAAVERLRELTEVRAMTVTVAGHALAELRGVANKI